MQDLQESCGGQTDLPIITMRLIIPSSMYDSLVGPGGCHIREATGTTLTVDSQTLANSTERAVNFTGPAEDITQCVFRICNAIQEVKFQMILVTLLSFTKGRFFCFNF